MAIEPFRRKIASPSAAPLVPFRPVQMPDIGADITNAALKIYSAYEPIAQQQAKDRAEQDAAKISVRDENGKLIEAAPETKGGAIYQESFNKLLKAKYLAEFSMDLQTNIDRLQGDITLGPAPTDKSKPDKFLELGMAHIEGALSAVPPEFRTDATELALREGQERFRAFRSSWTGDMERSAVQGVMQTITNLKGEYTKAVEDGANPQVLAGIEGRLFSVTQRLKDFALTAPHVQAVVDDAFADVGKLEDFANATYNSTALINALPNISESGLEALSNMGQGLADDSVVSVNLTGIKTSMTVSDGVLDKFVKFKFPIAATEDKLSSTGTRDLTDPRSINIKPIEGVSFDQFTATLAENGFTVLEARDESKPEDQAKYGNSRPNWYVNVAPKFDTMTGQKEDAASSIDSSTFNKIFPSKAVRSEISQLANRELAERRRKASEAAAAARAAAQLAATREMVRGIDDMSRSGIANYSAQQRNVLDSEFERTMGPGLANISTAQGLATAKAFMQKYSYMPNGLRAWFTSNLRNENTYRTALTLYNNVAKLRTNAGFLMGDVLTDQMSPKDDAILRRILSIQNGGGSSATQQSQVLAVLSGKDYPLSDIRASVEARSPGRVRNDMTNYLKNTFGIRGVPNPSIVRSYENTLEANINVYNGDYDQAVRATHKQMANVLVANPLFQGGVGYGSLFRKWTGGDVKVFNKALALYLEGTASGANGRRDLLVSGRDAKGNLVKPKIGGENSSIKISVIGDNVANPDKVRVTVYHPVTKAVVETQDIDLRAYGFDSYVKRAKKEIYGQTTSQNKTKTDAATRQMTTPGWLGN